MLHDKIFFCDMLCYSTSSRQPLTYADISGGFFDDDNDNEDKMVVVVAVDVGDGNVDFLSELKFQTLLCVSILFLSSFFYYSRAIIHKSY